MEQRIEKVIVDQLRTMKSTLTPTNNTSTKAEAVPRTTVVQASRSSRNKSKRTGKHLQRRILQRQKKSTSTGSGGSGGSGGVQKKRSKKQRSMISIATQSTPSLNRRRPRAEGEGEGEFDNDASVSGVSGGGSEILVNGTLLLLCLIFL